MNEFEREMFKRIIAVLESLSEMQTSTPNISSMASERLEELKDWFSQADEYNEIYNEMANEKVKSLLKEIK